VRVRVLMPKKILGTRSARKKHARPSRARKEVATLPRAQGGTQAPAPRPSELMKVRDRILHARELSLNEPQSDGQPGAPRGS